MASESGLKIDGKFYALEWDKALRKCKGRELLMLEDYLGGWQAIGDRMSVRTIVVGMWLAKKEAGESVTLEELEEVEGLMFGDTVEFVGDPFEDSDGSGSPSEDSEPSGTPSSPEPTSVTA